MIKRNNIDIKQEEKDKKLLEKQIKEDEKLNKYIKRMVIKYYKNMQKRLIKKKNDSISQFLNQMEQYIRKKFPEAVKRKFGNKQSKFI